MIVPVVLVDAHRYPGPALFQGIGMIVIAIGAVIYMSVEEWKDKAYLRRMGVIQTKPKREPWWRRGQRLNDDDVDRVLKG